MWKRNSYHTAEAVRDYPLLESKQQIQIDHARTGQTMSDVVGEPGYFFTPI